MIGPRLTEDVLRQAVQGSVSFSEVARKLGKQPKGGNVSALVSKCKKFGIDTSHIKGQTWAKDVSRLSDDHVDTKVFTYGGKGPHKEILIRERGRVCQCCSNSLWLGKPITLELEHTDGDRQNNTRNNLLLLCPNCHSYTPTWRGRNVKKTNSVTDEQLLDALRECKNIRQALLNVGMTPKGANYKRADKLLNRMHTEEQQDMTANDDMTHPQEVQLSPFTEQELTELLWTYPTTTIAKMYNMSDNGVAYWSRKWNLNKPPRGYWQKQPARGEIGRTQQP